ncbi:MAG: hypothetical protein KA988_05285 [Longilinea sp.]|nr:hypothetical protein [Longilinea sp.]
MKVEAIWKRAAWTALTAWMGVSLAQGGLGLLLWALFRPLRPLSPLYFWGVEPIDEGLRGALLGVWLRWDAVHYLRIAQAGYSDDQLSNFFPLYPLLGRLIGGGDALLGLMLVSRLALLIAFVLLYRLAAQVLDESVARRAVWVCAFFPTSVYLFAPYPMGLALALTLAAVWLAWRGQWLGAGVCGLLAGLTHGTVAPLTLALLALWVGQVRQTRRTWLALPAALMPALGTLTFFAWRTAQGFPDLNTVRLTYWGRVVQPPWDYYQEFVRFFTFNRFDSDGWINLVVLLLAILLTVWGLRRLPLPLTLYQGGMFLLITVTVVPGTPFEGAGRYVLMMFPLFLLLGAWANSPFRRLLLTALTVFLSLGLAGIYFFWGWVA